MADPPLMIEIETANCKMRKENACRNSIILPEMVTVTNTWYLGGTGRGVKGEL